MYGCISQLSAAPGALSIRLQHQAVQLGGAVSNQLLQITDEFVHKPLAMHLQIGKHKIIFNFHQLVFLGSVVVLYGTGSCLK